MEQARTAATEAHESRALAQLESYWCTGIMALVHNGWACPTVLDFLDRDQDDTEEEDEDGASTLQAAYYRTGGWTASASRADVANGMVEYTLRLGLPQSVAGLVHMTLGPCPGEYSKHLPKLMAFVDKFFFANVSKGSAVASSTGATFTFERDAVRLVIILTSDAKTKY
jgi:hypothetical protein